MPYFVLQGKDSIELLASHWGPLFNITSLPDYSVLHINQLVLLALIVILMTIGSLHFIATSYKDTVRVRQIFFSFITTAIFSITLLLILPHCYDIVIHVLILVISPMIAHFFALTNSRFTNVLFMITLTAILLVTGYNLWISSLHS